LTPAQGVAAFARVVRSPAAQVTVMPVDWPAWRESAPATADVPLLAALFREASGGGPAAAPALAAALRAAAPSDRRPILEAHLQQQVARVLRLPVSRLDVQRPLSTLGIDSLMAVELKNRIEGDLQLTLPLIQVIQGPSVAELAALLLAQLEGGDRAPAASEGPEAPRAKGESLLLSLLSLAEEEPRA
jgi:acyl carrier protein